jgi:hypothetical protein
METTNWADDVELEEQSNGPLADDDYPVLGAQPTKVKEPKGKAKKVKQTVNLRDFLGAGGPVAPRGGPSGKDILLHLPTASRGKEEGDDAQGAGMGGGFRTFGGERGERHQPV